MDLGTARKMLPLVQRIVTDILDLQGRLDRLQPELDRLDRHKRDLVWLERQRRYALRDEIGQREHLLQEAYTELADLGVALTDPELGRVGFPTMVNDRLAFFAWHPGENSITTWHFATEDRRRTIPTSWLEADLSSKS